MIIDDISISDLSQDLVLAFALIVFRVGAAMALLPAFGEQVVPVRIKLGATMAFSAIIAPFVIDEASAALSQADFIELIGPEVVAGLAFGFLFRALVFALQIAGSVAAQATSLSQFFGGGLGIDPQPAFSTLLVVAGLCLAVLLGLHIRIIELFALSYEVFPVGTWAAPAGLADWGVEQSARAFGLGFTLAGPFVLVSLIYNLGLGVINRAMPQLMVALVGAPAISFGALLILLLASPLILSVWGQTFIRIASPEGAGF
ncbi:flagellar biosynthetic protein FliR [Litoreibacter ponti]|uniref:Flagellar biosynthetic protein FliR n=1 Tax=Litoreibacter ponti TaxID=1510457 RepID=A0A2T6BNJ9_9RHOB|nr:flagellar biosynthetic protein FliR [Litoreibacter ponti]PTX57567.1 flagellar biosynthetic protein FliR [Litoreibacter ponti]